MRTTQLLAALLAPAMACAQAEKTPKWRIDPHTKNDPALMAKAGYVSFGPFRFGNLAEKPVTSDQVDATFEFIQILWTETAHFRIGTNLPAYAVPEDPETKAKLRKELEQLATRLPGINPKTRRLDPWLRAHLTAYRMEKLYAETSDLFGVKDEDFPSDPSKVVANAGRYMGYGPYFGMKDKYLVLVFDKEGSYRQYMKMFIGRDSSQPQRWHFVESSSILFTCACEDDVRPLKHDTALHCALAFNVSQNLMDGFRYYAYDLPVWMREAFGHWNSRRIDGKYPSFDQNEGSVADMKLIDRWEPYCRNLVSSNGKFAPFAEAYTWRDFGNITFNDHVALWSRMDWLQSQGPEKWQKFLFAVKGRVDKNWGPDQTDVVGATREALQQAYGLSILDFDRKWAEWVKATYPAQ